MREFVFYTRVPGDIERRLKLVQESFASHVLQFYVEEDATWDVLEQFG